MSKLSPASFADLYAAFPSPIATFDCGDKCAPYNVGNVPFCCDTRHAVPTAYQAEWEYLQAHTDLWHLWQAQDHAETARLQSQIAWGQVLIECLGHRFCQRDFRSLTCRAFPFFPYLTREGEFIGLSYYWQYEQRCWIISHLEVVTSQYRSEFIQTYEALFAACPEEKENFRYHAAVMRRVYSRRRQAIPLLHRNGKVYKISPSSGRMRLAPVESLPKFGPYQVAARLTFPEET